MDFFSVHSIFFLVAIAFFPRITMLIATPWGGLFWWLGLIFVPRFMSALLGTIHYWDTNPILCLIAWFVAFAGEGVEKSQISKRR